MIFGKIFNSEDYRLMGDDEWVKWFAWYPVCFNNGQAAWLETVEFNQPFSFNPATYRQIRK